MPLIRRRPRRRAQQLPVSVGLPLLLPVLAVLAGVFVYPVIGMLERGVFTPEFSLQHYYAIFERDLYLRTFWRTFRLSAVVTAVTLVLGFPVALLMARSTGGVAAIIAACVIFPLWTSVLVRSFAWTVLLSRNGLVNDALMRSGLIEQPLRLLYTEFAVVLALAHVMLPFMILPLYAVLRDIPKDVIRAASAGGASDFAVLRTIIVPLSMPGIAAGCTMVFLVSLGFFVTPLLLGGSRSLMIATLITQEVTQNYNWGLAAALSTTLLVVVLIALALLGRFVRIGRGTKAMPK